MTEFLDTLYKIEHSIRILRFKETARLERAPKTKTQKEAVDLVSEISKNTGLLAILLDGKSDSIVTRRK